MKTLFEFIFLSIVAASAWAQGIAPPVAEYRGSKANGVFEIQNTTNDAMAVTLDTRNFVVDEHGVVAYSPLDKNIKIRMGASSFVLAAHDKRMIFYKASFPTSPASFSIIATMTKAEQQTGMRIKFLFPHMIYVYQKEKLKRSDVTLQLVDNKLLIHNTSQKLGRVLQVIASKQDLGGFPIYPAQIREVDISGAAQASVKFEDGFSLSTP
jgi:hypothetical protein